EDTHDIAVSTFKQITLYTAKVCPYAQRVELALAEAKADFKSYQIDLQNKPEWYAPQVNPASKVPAIAYGGPNVSPDTPSPDSIKIAESLVLLEFIADLYPSAHLLPTDPVARAQTRFFIDAVSTKFAPAYVGFVVRGESYETVLKAFEAIQSLLPNEESPKFAVAGQYTIADAAIAPFAARLRLSVENEIGVFAPGEGAKLIKELKTPKYARFFNYVESLFQRDSFKATFDEEYVKSVFLKRFNALRAEK
ncbi:hypothetical protein SERLA73DRAFT_188693, partial [Serpula lacrymans var. lacrymans S7.3]